MENIKFEIKPSDIQEYLQNLRKNHPDIYAEYYQYKEAMFVKYMKESTEEITAESLEILMNKYNFDDVSPALGIYSYHKNGNIIQNGLDNFPFYLSNVKNLDISGICHIMIPIASYYMDCPWFSRMVPHPKQMLSLLVRKMNIIDEDTNDNYLYSVTYDTIDNYSVAFENKVYRDNYGIFISFSKDKSRKMIQAYSSIYGEEPVKQIRKIIRERV